MRSARKLVGRSWCELVGGGIIFGVSGFRLALAGGNGQPFHHSRAHGNPPKSRGRHARHVRVLVQTGLWNPLPWPLDLEQAMH